jgi:peptide/nickel transport system permease protein
MWRFLLRRLGMAALTVFVSSVAVTLLIHLVPGDPVEIMYAQSQGTTPEQLEAIRHNLGLDRSIPEQYFQFVGRILHGDLGVTVRGQQPVLGLLLQRLPNTLLLSLSAMALALIIGVPLGFAAAYRRGGWVDTAIMGVAMVGISIPSFWLGLVLLFFFAVQLGWLPVAGSGLLNLVLPGVTLGVANAAILARITRSSMIDTLNEDFVRTAEAKGLPRAVVLNRHVLRVGLLPLVTILGMQFAYLMGGAIVVENIFAWNGIGRLAIDAIFQRDYPVIQGFILVFSLVVVVVSILLDIAYVLLDPRVRRA